jgi:hypothetical protein
MPSERDTTGGPTLEKVKSVVEQVKGDESIFLTNNVPHIKSLEYGWYGKWEGDKFIPANTGKVIQGYSRGAPHGMIGRVMAQAKQIFQAAVSAVKGGGA